MSTQTVALCQCGGNVNNLGLPGCLPELGAPRRFWFGEVNKEDGTRNAFDPSVTLDLAYMDGFLKAEIAQDRVLPSDNVKDFTPEKADPVTEESASGAKGIVREGAVTHTAVFWVNDPYTYKALFDSRKCKQNAVWIEDTNGNLIGEATADGKLGGRKVEVNSMVATVTDPKFDELGKLTVTWSYELASGDEKVSYIKASDFDADFTTAGATALLDAELSFVGSPGQTGGTFLLYLLYGSLGQKIPVTGLTPSNLEGYNEDTPAAVTLITCSDSITDGTYVYTHASQTLADVFHIQGASGVTIQNGIDTKLINAVSSAIA